MPSGKGIVRGTAPVRALLALPPLLTLSAAPLAAAMPSRHLVSLCTAEGPRLVLVEGEDPIGRPGDRDHHDQMGCVHALCPRESPIGRKARGRA